MTDRPILRLPDPVPGTRLKGKPDRRRRPRGVGAQGQGARHRDVFDQLDQAFRGDAPDVSLRQNPNGIAPERALVFETIVGITNFQRSAARLGFELLIEDRLPSDYQIPEEMADDYIAAASPTLYAMMPTLQDLQQLLRMWRSYQRGETAPYGQAPWWNLFAMLSDIRPWGPQDRLNRETIEDISQMLQEHGDAPVKLEFEIWPTANAGQRDAWRTEVNEKIEELGGAVLSHSSINEPGFIYEAVLSELPSNTVEAMLNDPTSPGGIAVLDGIQFILPQTVAQSLPNVSDELHNAESDELGPFDPEAPIRAVLLDGTPVAAHPAIEGGVAIEDIFDIVRLSEVRHRKHATSMASLILRGDLLENGAAVADARLLSIPILIDGEHGAVSPNDQLFVDVVHTALAAAFEGENALAPEAHLVNFSIGIQRSNFSGQISALARLLDWWSEQYGVLFVVSAGNIPDDLVIPNKSIVDFEDATPATRQEMIEAAKRDNRHERTILSPGEAMNPVTIGAASIDFSEPSIPTPVGILPTPPNQGAAPAIYSAIGLGAFRSVKPDFIVPGGAHEIRATADGDDVRLRLIGSTSRTGLNVAAAEGTGPAIVRTRGTSCATALASRASLQAVAALSDPGGPYEGQELPIEDRALISKALSVSASRWPDDARSKFDRELQRLNGNHYQAREEVCRYYGHGLLDENLMIESPETGATLVGLGTVRKDRAAVFQVPLPPSLSGQAVGRTLVVTVAWFSPVKPTRARYRLALLEAVSPYVDEDGDTVEDKSWSLALRGDQLDAKQIIRGTVWSRRLGVGGLAAPAYPAGSRLPVSIQCRDGSGGGLDSDTEVRFAVAVTLETEAGVRFDVHQEIQEQLRVRLD